MKLYKSDLKKIGGTHYSKDGNLHILCDISTANIEEVLLRNILELFGDYEIKDAFDFEWDNGDMNIEFVTNLPWDEYIKL